MHRDEPAKAHILQGRHASQHDDPARPQQQPGQPGPGRGWRFHGHGALRPVRKQRPRGGGGGACERQAGGRPPCPRLLAMQCRFVSRTEAPVPLVHSRGNLTLCTCFPVACSSDVRRLRRRSLLPSRGWRPHNEAVRARKKVALSHPLALPLFPPALTSQPSPTSTAIPFIKQTQERQASNGLVDVYECMFRRKPGRQC